MRSIGEFLSGVEVWFAVVVLAGWMMVCGCHAPTLCERQSAKTVLLPKHVSLLQQPEIYRLDIRPRAGMALKRFSDVRTESSLEELLQAFVGWRIDKMDAAWRSDSMR